MTNNPNWFCHIPIKCGTDINYEYEIWIQIWYWAYSMLFFEFYLIKDSMFAIMFVWKKVLELKPKLFLMK